MSRLLRAAKHAKSFGLARRPAKKSAAKRPMTKGSVTKRSTTKGSVTKRPSKENRGKPSWLKKGDDEIAKQKQRGASNNLFMDVPNFFLKNGEKARVRFVEDFEDVTISVSRHTYKKVSQSGKPYYVSFTCTGDENCLGCANGDKASARWPVLLIDLRKTDVYDNGVKTEKRGAVKLFMPSIQEHENLRLALEEENERRARKGEDPVDLRDVIFTVTRVGEKSQTSYRFSVFDEEPLDVKYERRYEAFIEKHGDLEKILEPLSEEDQQAAIDGAVDNKGGRGPAPKKERKKELDPYDDDDDDDDEYLDYDDD